MADTSEARLKPAHEFRFDASSLPHLKFAADGYASQDVGSKRRIADVAGGSHLVPAALAADPRFSHADFMDNPPPILISVLKPKRRWAQFSLGFLLLIVTALCLLLGLVIVPGRRQARAVAAIQSLQAQIVYATDSGGFVKASANLLPRRWLPRDYVEHVREVNLSGTMVMDRDLAHLQALPGLERLDFVHTRITDAGLEHLKHLTKLRVLSLRETHVTDAGLARLRKLTELQTLVLNGTKITGTGLEQLNRLRRLKAIYLVDAQVNDAGLAHLPELPGLEELYLGNARIMDAGLVPLQRLSALRTLGLNGTRVTDAGLVHLLTLTNLERLNLRGTQITDAGLNQLSALPALRVLCLGGLHVSAAKVAQLRAALPGCEIEWP